MYHSRRNVRDWDYKCDRGISRYNSWAYNVKSVIPSSLKDTLSVASWTWSAIGTRSRQVNKLSKKGNLEGRNLVLYLVTMRHDLVTKFFKRPLKKLLEADHTLPYGGYGTRNFAVGFMSVWSTRWIGLHRR